MPPSLPQRNPKAGEVRLGYSHTGFPLPPTSQIVPTGTKIYLRKLNHTLDCKTRAMPLYDLQLRVIHQILISLHRAEFPLPWATGTVKPWILWEFTFAFSYGHSHRPYGKN